MYIIVNAENNSAFTIIILFLLPCTSDDSSSLQKSYFVFDSYSLAGLAEVVSITHCVSNERPPTSSPCISANSKRNLFIAFTIKIQEGWLN